MTTWDAKAYSKFLDLRTRPARDLLAAIPDNFQPAIVHDLGCGPGNSTRLLKDRWPQAQVIGIDSSPEMLIKARQTSADIEFTEGDIAEFSLDKKTDLLFANASLQWLSKHEILLPKLLQHLNASGFLAIQIPNNFHAPSHQVTIQLLAANQAWLALINKLQYGKLTRPLYDLRMYYDILTQAGTRDLQLWETQYYQEMSSHEEIFNWIKATALRPVLAGMNNEEQIQFAHAYIQEIATAYPVQTNQKILFPFNRIFIIGMKT